MVGDHDARRLDSRGGAAKRQTNSDTGHVSAKISQKPASHSSGAVDAAGAERAAATPVKKKTVKPRPTSIGGSSSAER